jgi:hypothetical protein
MITPASRARIARSAGERAVHVAQVVHLGHAPVLAGGHLPDRREDRDHRVVHPDVDPPPLAHHAARGVVDGVGVGHVEREDHGISAERLDLSRGRLEPVEVARDQRHLRALAAVRPRDRAPDAARGAGDDRDHSLELPHPLHRPHIRSIFA